MGKARNIYRLGGGNRRIEVPADSRREAVQWLRSASQQKSRQELNAAEAARAYSLLKLADYYLQHEYHLPYVEHPGRRSLRENVDALVIKARVIFPENVEAQRAWLVKPRRTRGLIRRIVRWMEHSVKNK